MPKIIETTDNYFVVLDDEDYSEVIKYSWFTRLSGSGKTRYAVTNIDKSYTSMHRLILQAPKDLQVDHINHDGLDNRRSNIRLATPAQNQYNSRSREGSSKFKGAHWVQRDKCWRAHISKENIRYTLGTFATEVEAALAYDEHARRLFKDFAYLNFPEFFDYEMVRRKQKAKTSSHVGVCWTEKSGGKWRAYFWNGSKQVHLGYFDTETEAIWARDQAKLLQQAQ